MNEASIECRVQYAVNSVVYEPVSNSRLTDEAGFRIVDAKLTILIWFIGAIFQFSAERKYAIFESELKCLDIGLRTLAIPKFVPSRNEILERYYIA